MFKTKKVLLFAMLIVCSLFTLKTKANTYAAESTASIKGFNTENLTYMSDKDSKEIKVETDKWYYGSYSLWSACYKYVANESNGSKTCYYFALIDSYINSYGKNGDRYFRNKQLLITVTFEGRSAAGDYPILTEHAPDSSNATVSDTIGFTIGGSGSVGDNTGVGVNASLTMTKTTTYSAVTIKGDDLAKECTESKKFYQFTYKFANWDDGSMVSPNIGLVRERMFVVFRVENYTGTDAFDMTITTKATIFKDAKWPLSNATVSRTVEHKYISGYID